MSWRQTNLMEERRQMINDWVSGMYTKSALAIRYGVSRPTIDLWISRFTAEGEPGLADRSHAAQSCPHRSSAEIEAIIVAIRREHPDWGPQMIRDRLHRSDPQLQLPAASTIGTMLTRADLIHKKPRRSKASAMIRSTVPEVTASNQLWNIDFKGQHRLRNTSYIYPLTLSDTYSRYVLCCDGYPSTEASLVRQTLERVFAEYGLPQMIRSDNGSPFAGNGLWRLSRLRVWWIQLGITQLLTRPGCPQDNGQHERFHRTLKAQTVFPIAADELEQQRRYDLYLVDFNQHRPHRGLDGAAPADLYRKSDRALPSVILPPEYPGQCEVRKVQANGTIKFQGQRVFLSETLAHQLLGLELISEDIWTIRYYTTELGRLNARTMQIR